ISPVEPMYMAGRLRTASMPPRTLMESAVYSPSAWPLPFFVGLRGGFSLSTSIGLLFSGAAAAADWESFGGILLHSIGNTDQTCVAPSFGQIVVAEVTFADNPYLP